jgi:hypothetical protein
VRRSDLIGLVAYALVVGSLATPLYEPLGPAGDGSWLPLLTVVAVHVALGLLVRPGWVLAVPVGLAVLAGVLSPTLADAVLWVLLGALLAGVTSAAQRSTGALGRAAAPPALAALALALVPAGVAAVETARRGPPAPAAVQARLPLTLRLGELCPTSETDAEVVRDLRRRAEALLVELRRRPQELVPWTTHVEAGPPETEQITIRELAEVQLESMRDNGPNCDPPLERRLRAAL